VLAPNEPGAAELAIDGGDLYWTIDTLGGAIHTCAIEECAPRSLADGLKSPHSMLVVPEDVIWASGDEIYRVNRIRAGTQLVVQIDENGEHQVQMLRYAPPYLYWSTNDSFWRCDYEATETCMFESSVSVLSRYHGPLALDGSDQLWVTGEDGMRAFGLSSMTVQRTFSIGGIVTLVANATHVFAVQNGGTEVLAWPVTAPNEAQPTRISTGGSPRALALDGNALFVAEQAGRIVRIPLLPDLGEPEEIAVGLPRIETLAVSTDRIYLIADGRLIAWLPKL
jgi:hypothetical protein